MARARIVAVRIRSEASFDERLSRRAAMWDLDSYRDFLDEHTSRHHTIGSALIVLAVVGAVLFLLG
jgi:hypothetical protein